MTFTRRLGACIFFTSGAAAQLDFHAAVAAFTPRRPARSERGVNDIRLRRSRMLADQNSAVRPEFTPNGRIGLLLNPLPPLLFAFEKNSTADICLMRAWLEGSAEPLPPPPEADRRQLALPETADGAAGAGAALTAQNSSRASPWEPQLLWQLGKIYCARHADHDGARYPAEDDDQDSWAKARFCASDAALVLNAAADAASAALESPNTQSAVVSVELSFGPPPPPPPASAALVVDAAVPELSDLREAVATRVLVS
jgi:hypothetical protein